MPKPRDLAREYRDAILQVMGQVRQDLRAQAWDAVHRDVHEELKARVAGEPGAVDREDLLRLIGSLTLPWMDTSGPVQ